MPIKCQSLANRIPVSRFHTNILNSCQSTNPKPIYQSIADPQPIKKYHINQLSIPCQSTNPMSIHYQSVNSRQVGHRWSPNGPPPPHSYISANSQNWIGIGLTQGRQSSVIGRQLRKGKGNKFTIGEPTEVTRRRTNRTPSGRSDQPIDRQMTVNLQSDVNLLSIRCQSNVNLTSIVDVNLYGRLANSWGN